MAIDTTHMAAESGIGPGEKFFSDPLARKNGSANNIYIKSEGRILDYRVTRSWSERSNLYNSYTPSTNTKT